MWQFYTLPALLFYLFSLNIYPQNSIADSLEGMYVNAKTDSLKLNLLTKICTEYTSTDTAKAKFYCEQMLIEAAKSNSIIEKARAYHSAGNYYRILCEYSKSIDYFKMALNYYHQAPGQIGVIGYGKALIDYASVFHFNGDFRTALTKYLEADSLLSNLKEYNTLLNLYSSISDVYMKLSQMDRSKVYVDKINSIIGYVTDPVVKSRLYISHANMLVYQNKYAEAVRYFKMARLIAERSKKYNVLTSWANSYGFMLSRQSKYDEALIYYNKAMNYARRFGSKYDECDALYKTGLMNYYAKRFDNAYMILKKALKYSEVIKSKLLIRNVLDALTRLEADRGNYQLAYNYLQQYVKIDNEMFNESDIRTIDFLNAKYESAKKEEKIRHLTNVEKIKSSEIQIRENIIYMFSAFMILAVITIFFVQRYYTSKKKIAEQNNLIKEHKIIELEKEKQIAAIQYALQGEEKERSRLARDLHDGLGGLLSGTKMALNSFKQHYGNTESLQHPMDLLNKSIGELQRIAHNMMPQALVNGSIKDALAEYCEKMDDNGALSLKFRFFGTEEKIGQNYQIAVYRIVQELVNNVFKYSGASDAFVQLVQEKGRISITVHDNGNGFDPSALKLLEGHGFNNIRLRVESLGGRFDIDSSLGKGTEASVEFENLD